jgi:Putative phage tail protein
MALDLFPDRRPTRPPQVRLIPRQPRPSVELRVSSSPIGRQWPLLIGRCRATADYLQWGRSGNYVIMAYRLGVGRCSSVTNLRVQDQPQADVPALQIAEIYYGTDTQAASPAAGVLWPDSPSGARPRWPWISYLVLYFASQSMADVGGLPAVTADCSLMAWDPWAGTPAWIETENSILSLYTYCTLNPWGPRWPASEINLASWSDARDWCDDLISTRARCRAGGVLRDGTWETAITAHLRAAQCEMAWVEGQWRLYPRRDATGAVPSITATSVRRRRLPWSSRVSEVRVAYQDADGDYADSEAVAYAGDQSVYRPRSEAPRLINAGDTAARDADMLARELAATCSHSATVDIGVDPGVLDVSPGQLIDLSWRGWASAKRIRVSRVVPGPVSVELEGTDHIAESTAGGGTTPVDPGDIGDPAGGPASPTGISLTWYRSRDRRTATAEDASSWAGSGGTVTVDVEDDPAGGTTADRVQGTPTQYARQISDTLAEDFVADDGSFLMCIWLRSNTGSDQDIVLRTETSGGRAKVVKVRPWWQLHYVAGTTSGSPYPGPRLIVDPGQDVIVGGAFAWPCPADQAHREMHAMSWTPAADAPYLDGYELQYKTVPGTDPSKASEWITAYRVPPDARSISWGTMAAALPALEVPGEYSTAGPYLYAWRVVARRGQQMTELVPSAVSEEPKASDQLLSAMSDVDASGAAPGRVLVRNATDTGQAYASLDDLGAAGQWQEIPSTSSVEYAQLGGDIDISDDDKIIIRIVGHYSGADEASCKYLRVSCPAGVGSPRVTWSLEEDDGTLQGGIRLQVYEVVAGTTWRMYVRGRLDRIGMIQAVRCSSTERPTTVALGAWGTSTPSGTLVFDSSLTATYPPQLWVDNDGVYHLGAELATLAALTAHTGSTSNPHSVTAAQLGAVTETGDHTLSGDIEHTGDVELAGRWIIGWRTSAYSVSTGTITISASDPPGILIDAPSYPTGATLHTINGGVTGQRISLRITSGTRPVQVVKYSSYGNISLTSSYMNLISVESRLELELDSTGKWVVNNRYEIFF